jgi:hypothetical protein
MTRLAEIAICGDHPFLKTAARMLLPSGHFCQMEKLSFSSKCELEMVQPDFIIFESANADEDLMTLYWLTHPAAVFLGVNPPEFSAQLYLAGQPSSARILLKS